MLSIYMNSRNAFKKLNWGAFLLAPIWSIWFGVWIGLWSLIPMIGLFFQFLLLFKGNEWAFKKSHLPEEEFFRVQKHWAWAGVIGFISMAVFFIAFIFVINNSAPLQKALEIAAQNSRVSEQLGAPVRKDGFWSGGEIKIDFRQKDKIETIKLDLIGSKKKAHAEFVFLTAGTDSILASLTLNDENDGTVELIDTKIKWARDSRIESINDAMAIFNDQSDKEGFLVYKRSENLNDFIQTSWFTEGDKKCFILEYSEGFTKENMNIFQAEEECMSASQVEALFKSYSQGSDQFKQAIVWKRLKTIE